MKEDRKTKKRKDGLKKMFIKWVNQCSEPELAVLEGDIDNLMDSWSNKDFFGTEGQFDPRGDRRS